MMQIKNPLRYFGTISYIVFIVGINVGLAHLPIYHIWACEISPMDPLVGLIYIMRDFAQRELGHAVFVAMFVGAGLSYLMSTPEIAFASVTAFIAGELVDWAIFTFTKKPLKDRLLWSASVSAPIDSVVFLAMIARVNILAVALMTLGKWLGVLMVWYFYVRVFLNRPYNTGTLTKL